MFISEMMRLIQNDDFHGCRTTEQNIFSLTKKGWKKFVVVLQRRG